MSEVVSTGNESSNATSPKITIHHLNNSRSQRILWLLEELELPYEIKKYQRTADQLVPEELRKVHRLGKAPVITVGDTVIAESGAIIQYLVDRFGHKLQPSPANTTEDLYWVHYSEGTLMPLLVNKFVFSYISQRSPFFIKPIANILTRKISEKMLNPRLAENAEMIEEHLAKSATGWFAGEDHPSAADFMMSFPLEAMKANDLGALGDKTKAFVEKIHGRDAYKRALEKGGKYDYAA